MKAGSIFVGTMVFLLVESLQLYLAEQAGLAISIIVPVVAAIATTILLILRKGTGRPFERRVLKTVMVSSIVVAIADGALVLHLVS